MRIASIEVLPIELPLEVPFVISYATYDTMPSVIVKLTTDTGHVGYGEGVADEHVTGESLQTVCAVIEETLAPRLIGMHPNQMERIHEVMNRAILDNPTAKAAIDIACYDVTARAYGVPVYDLLGGRYHEEFPVTHVLSIGEPKDLAQEARRKVEEGYTSFKMKVGYDVADDLKRIQMVRRAVGPHIAIRIDANQGWQTSAGSMQAIHALEPVELDWIEQPIRARDISGMRALKEKTRTPLMIDEGICHADDLRHIIEKDACDKINIKLMKCGGIFPAMKLIHMAEMAGLDCQIGSMVESSIGSAAGLHVGFASKQVTSVELTGPLKFTEDVGDLADAYNLPMVRLPETPGLGCTIDEMKIDELLIDRVLV